MKHSENGFEGDDEDEYEDDFDEDLNPKFTIASTSFGPSYAVTRNT